MESVKCVLISANPTCGRSNMRWDANGLAYYPTTNNVMVYDVERNTILFTLHTKQPIKSLAIGIIQAKNSIVTAAGTSIFAWICKANPKLHSDWELCEQFTDSTIEIIQLLSNYVITYDLKGMIKLYSLENTKCTPICTLNIGPGLIEGMSTFIFKDTIMLAVGGHKKQLLLYALENNTFIRKCAVDNTEGSIMGISAKASESRAEIATSSSDGFIGIWKIERSTAETSILHTKSSATFELSKQQYSISIDSILSAHSGSVSSIQWGSNGTLLSSSMDCSISIWQHNEKSVFLLNRTYGTVMLRLHHLQSKMAITMPFILQIVIKYLPCRLMEPFIYGQKKSQNGSSFQLLQGILAR